MNSCVDLIQQGTRLLEEEQVHRPQWTAEQLLAERVGCLPVDLYALKVKILEGDRILYLADVAARASGVPLQYLLGTADFYGRRFAVGPGVFNPRPETEVLVETALGLLEGTAAVADVGTGSGAIAVTLAKERPRLEVAAVERSSVALHFARRNAAAQGCRVRFFEGNLLEPLKPASLDGIVANLPYLNPEQAMDWPRELGWEPWLALDGGRDGLELIEALIRQAAGLLEPERWLALEIGLGQAPGVRLLAEKNGFRVERTVQDLAGLDRVMVLWKN